MVAHGISLRALKVYLEGLSPADTMKVNIPAGTPRDYDFDENMKVISVNYL